MAVMAGAGAALQSFDFGCLICSTRAAMALGCIDALGNQRKTWPSCRWIPCRTAWSNIDRVFSVKISNISNTHLGKHIFIDLHMWCMTESIIWNRLKVHPTDTRGLEVKPLMTSSCIASLPCRQGKRKIKVDSRRTYTKTWGTVRISLGQMIGNMSEPLLSFCMVLKSSYMYVWHGFRCLFYEPPMVWCIQQFGWSPVGRTYMNMLHAWLLDCCSASISGSPKLFTSIQMATCWQQSYLSGTPLNQPMIDFAVQPESAWQILQTRSEVLSTWTP